MDRHLLGIDTGGTFTDFVYLHQETFRVHKVLSTPEAPEKAIFRGISDLGLEGLAKSGKLKIVHGSTVATNATLEGKGVTTAYITNHGLKDLLRIGRQTRPDLYDLRVQEQGLEPDERCLFEVGARTGADGSEINGFHDHELEELKEAVNRLRPGAIAINLLFSFLDDRHERMIEDLFTEDYFVSRSSFVLPEYREYERGIATWINAFLGPLIERYLGSVARTLDPAPVSVMQSSGVSIFATQAARRAVNLLLSGPVGGLRAAQHVCTPQKLITFDMGGTSTDVALIDGEIRLTNEGRVADLPVAIPMADIHTIGAGGGSVAFIDEGGLLRVGPSSAGADPGPACYGRGGLKPTVTDANLILERLRADDFLGGTMHLDREAAHRALAPLADALELDRIHLARGIIEIANEHMAQALRVISVERGFDPRDFTLVCFGGAGGLHFCDLAESLEMTRALVPVHSGVLSALGMLATHPGREIIHTHKQPFQALTDTGLAGLFSGLQERGEAELLAEGVTRPTVRRSLDVRYLGQTHTLTVPYRNLADASRLFHDTHAMRYGHRLDKPLELLNLRLRLEAPGAAPELPDWQATCEDAGDRIAELPGIGPVPVIERLSLHRGQRFAGPALITEKHATTLIKTDWKVVVDRVGNLILDR